MEQISAVLESGVSYSVIGKFSSHLRLLPHLERGYSNYAKKGLPRLELR